MAAPQTCKEFLDVARRSEQIDLTRLDAYLRRQDQTLPPEPKKLARLLVRNGLMTGFQAEQFLLGKFKGFQLDNYRLIDRIGVGGTGTVYLAEHKVMRCPVAVKILSAALADNEAMRARFRREAQAVAALNHPNIVRANDFGRAGTIHYLVMEYIDGPSLQQVIEREGALPVARACDYIRQAAIGLQYAHEAVLVHRDIKPANLLVNSSGTVKILDLGLVRFTPEGEESLTKKFDEHSVMGTADYLAPEQALHLHDADARADIYSLGATFHALLTGKPPFPEGTAPQKLLWHQTRTPTPVCTRRPEVPAEVGNLIAAMMAKVPAQRVQSCAEVAALLEPWCQGTSGTAPSQRLRARVPPAIADSAEPEEQDNDFAEPLAPPVGDLRLGGGQRLLRLLWPAAILAGVVLLLASALFALLGVSGSATSSPSKEGNRDTAERSQKPPDERPDPFETLLADRHRVVETLLPLAERKGDRARGKQVFDKHCAACHAATAPGGRVGPDLGELAASPRQDLLGYILVPRRGTAHSFLVSDVTTTDGRVFTGLLIAPTETSIDVIDSQARRTTLQRAQIKQSAVTTRSLMPYDFEKRLDEGELVDLLAFLTHTGKYQPLPLEGVATSISTLGMFHSEDNLVERLVFSDWKPKWVDGVPFALVDPRGQSRHNVVLLHGPHGTSPPRMPRSVSLPCGKPVKTVHLLGGVCGWGYPFGKVGSVSLIVRLHYQDGQMEDHPLKNGEHLADYIRRVDVPESKFAFDVGGRQVRYLAVHANRSGPVTTIELLKGPDNTAPIVMAVTVEAP